VVEKAIKLLNKVKKIDPVRQGRGPTHLPVPVIQVGVFGQETDRQGQGVLPERRGQLGTVHDKFQNGGFAALQAGIEGLPDIFRDEK